MMKNTGIAESNDIDKVFPSKERLKKGAVAIFECYEKIPCNPCQTTCKQNAILSFKDINDLPTINHEKCTGCGLCIAKCPGLAIMTVDLTYSETEALMKIPFEFLPLPDCNEILQGLDRKGDYVDDVRVNKVLNPLSFDKTSVIEIAVKKEYIKVIRNIRRYVNNER